MSYNKKEALLIFLVIVIFGLLVYSDSSYTGMAVYIEAEGGGSGPPSCREQWQCGEWSECVDEMQIRECVDLNGCGTQYRIPDRIMSCIPDYYDFNDYLEFSLIEYRGTLLDASDISINITSEINLTDVNISLARQETLEDGQIKVFDISVSDELNDNLESGILTVYYNERSGYNESSYNLYVYESNWTALNAIFYTSGNYVVANLYHFSRFAILGDEIIESEDDDGTSGSSDSQQQTTTQDSGGEFTDCNENWSCGEWSECVDGAQTRECHDDNFCGTSSNKPEEVIDCNEETADDLAENGISSNDSNIGPTGFATGNIPKTNLIGMFIVLGIVAVGFTIYLINKKRRK